MPVFRRYEWSNYTASIYPAGKIRRFVRFFPYLNGSYISFIVRIQKRIKAQGMINSKYEWQLWRWDVNAKDSVENGGEEFQIPRRGKVKKKLDIAYLFIPGQYILGMRILESIDGKENFGSFEEVATFTILDRDLFSAQWLVGIIGGVIGAGLTALVFLLRGG